MKLKLRRRSIYVGTIVALVAMIGGFALAAGAFGGTFTSNGYNSGSAVSGDTIYSAGGVSVSYAPEATTGCSANPTTTAVAATNVYVGGTCVTGDWYAAFTFTATIVAGTGTDNFAVSEAGSNPAAGSIHVSVTYVGTETLTVYLDLGTATPPASITTVSAAVTGNQA